MEMINSFERSVVLQHLEKFLETCPRQEIGRIDREMYKYISEMAAVESMLGILRLHRPNFVWLAQDPLNQPGQVWQVHSLLQSKPSSVSCSTMALGSALGSSARFRMPTGRRDEQWLIRRDQAQQALSDLWKKARHAHQMTLEASDIPQSLIESQLAMMKQTDSPENKAQLDREAQQIRARLQAETKGQLPAKDTETRGILPAKDTETKGQLPAKDTEAKGLVPAKDTEPKGILPAKNTETKGYRIQETAKEKTKTRPDAPSKRASLHAKYAAAFANLDIDDKIDEKEKAPPVLYTLKPNSIAFQVMALMFPDRSKGAEDGGKTIDWLDYVSTMNSLGFAAEHRGGSAFTFKGLIRLPSDPSTREKRSISVHMPHPSTEMGPILLQSLGRRFCRRFGWQRANFAVEEG